MAMTQVISAVTLVVPDYEAALQFYVGQLGFELVEDTQLSPGKRWLRVRPQGSGGTCLLLAKADGAYQTASIGAQAGGRVAFFLATDDFARDHASYLANGVQFMELPRHEAYGTVAVFRDPFGNLWDLIEPSR
jgi:catechol 2,3-dioxygenase-like lactoylglutathione lyase family enzyme